MDPVTITAVVAGLVQLTQAIVQEVQNSKTLDSATQAQLIAQIQAAQGGIPTDPV